MVLKKWFGAQANVGLQRRETRSARYAVEMLDQSCADAVTRMRA
jgi:hypothetical protein